MQVQEISRRLSSCSLYEIYDELRETNPFFFSEDGPLILTRYEDVSKILKNKYVSVNLDGLAEGKSAKYIRPYKEIKQSLPRLGSFNSLLRMDGHEHDELKKILAPFFSLNSIQKMEEFITTLTKNVLNDLKEKNELEVMSDFASKIPVRAISKMLNVDEEINNFLYEWSEIVSALVEPSMSTEDIERIQEFGPKGFLYFIELCKNEKKYKNSKFLSEIINLTKENKSFTFENVISVVALLYVAGVETMTYTLTNCIYEIAKNPSQIEIIKNYSELNDQEKSKVVDELFRLCGSARQASRVATKEINHETSKGNILIPKGTIIHAVLGAANRDPEIFNNPNKLDLQRENAFRHLTFGAGPHFCLGANLAKLELPIALSEFFKEFSNIKISSEPIYRNRMTITGIKNLEMSIT